MKVELDLKHFDTIELTKLERNNLVWRLSALSELARKYLREKKISKVTYNRIHRLWLFLPREENQRAFMSFDEYAKLFNIKPLNMIYTQNALNKLSRMFQNERTSRPNNNQKNYKLRKILN